MRTRSTPYTTIRTEGALLPPELLQRVADLDKDLGGLKPPDYHLGENERLGEAISRSWNRLTGVWAAFAPSLDGFGEDDPGTGVTREKWLAPLFQELGFGRLETARATEIEGRTYPISHRWREVPIHLVGAGLDLNRRTPGAKGAARSSPHSMLQELLNRTESLWGIVSNGGSLRLLRDNVSLTRQAYVEFDLASMFSGEVYSDFALLWLVCHESRFEGEGPEECWLERWSQAAQQQGTRALDTLRGGVEQAISALGSGFLAHPANASLRDRLRDGKLSPQDYYRQLLRLVYRLIFLFVAEDRELLQPPGTPDDAQRHYRDYYSSSRLRLLAERRRGSKHSDLYEALKLVMASFGRDEGRTELGLPALGSFLWSEGGTPALDQAQLPNSHLLQATRALAFTTQGKLLRAVDYRNMGSEELGSIYESLLELHPEVHQESATFELATAAGHERKTTGSYYTPTSLINVLLDSALDPVLEEAASKPDGEHSILELKVLDPACGSGHFLVAAAHRISKRLAAVRTGDEEPSPEAYRSALRDVIGRCVYGIDMNPMAVELCKVSLWMEAVEPGKPLSFLEHHIVGGNSLLGTTPRLLADGIPDEAFKPLEGDDRKVVSDLKRRNREEQKGQEVLFAGPSVAELTKPLAVAVAQIEDEADASLEDLRSKEKGWASLLDSDEAQHASLVANAWCAAFVMRKVKGAPVLTSGVLRLLISDPAGGDPNLHREVSALAEHYRFFHPHLAFPGVLPVPPEGEDPESEEAGWSGGFHVVVGNPPWERVKLQEKEFFSAVEPKIASEGDSAVRARLIAAVESSNPALYLSFRRARERALRTKHLLAASGRFPMTAVGDLNSYALFAELGLSLIQRSGRLGMLTQTQLVTEKTHSRFLGHLLRGRQLASCFAFENEHRLFPAVHHSTRFILLSLATNAAAIEMATGLLDISHLQDPKRRYRLTASDVLRFNPDTGTLPLFRTSHDADIAASIYERFAPLRDATPFRRGVTASRVLHDKDDAHLFVWDSELAGNEGLLPVIESKLFEQYNHRYATYEGVAERDVRKGYPRVAREKELGDKNFTLMPRKWVREEDTPDRFKSFSREWLLHVRKITNNIALRTVVAAITPRYPNNGSAAWVRDDSYSVIDYLFLLGILNSIPFDYLARQKVGGINLNSYHLYQMPVPPFPSEEESAAQTVLWTNALELTLTSNDLSGLGSDVRNEVRHAANSPQGWDPQRRRILATEIDAAAAVLYELERDRLAWILDPDPPGETFRVLKAEEEKEFGQYRKKAEVLNAYDRFVPG